LQNKYDILILGAGLGGLECALILSKKGFKVCVLEKNKHIGGTLQNFELHGCTFSSGMHYLGSLEDGQVLNKLFRFFGILDKLHLKKMDDEVFDRFNIGGDIIDYPMGWNNFREKMLSYFPHEKAAIDRYIQLINEVINSQAIYNLQEPGSYDIRENLFLKTGIYDAVQSITKNKDLQNALCALNFVYAGDKHTSSLYTHALVNNYYINSAYRLIGGSSQVADLLAQNIRENGGDILTETEVKKFLFENDQMVGVKTSSGQKFYSDKVISNIHPTATLEKLEEGRIRKSFRNRINSIKNTISVFGLHLKLKPGSFPYLGYNYHYYKHKDVWAVSTYDEEKWPEFYYLYTPAPETVTDMVDGVSLYAYMQFDEVSQWADLPMNDRGPGYETWKEQKAKKLITLASEQFPVLNDNVVDWIAATPLTYRDYIGTPGGGMYGTLRDYKNPMASYVFPRTKIPNLYFTGQNINLHGMLGVSISALLTCGEIVDLHELIKEVNNG